MKSSMTVDKQALPFILINDANQFCLNSEGVKLFESQTEPFGVLIATGLYRTGKSYLLNQLMGEHNFKVDPTTEACTRGIWATSKNAYEL
jgi:putative ribosome biogenesis GTPase RsgA